MITSKRELKEYIDADLRSIGIYPLSLKQKISGWLFGPCRWRMQVKLRRLEYYINTHPKHSGPVYEFRNKMFERYCRKLACELYPNVFGPGLCINHSEAVVVNGFARVGSNCRINAGVNIGSFGRYDGKSAEDNAPAIGNNVYIGPGAKIFGKIRIGDNVAIGANAVVLKDVPDNATVVGVPGRILENRGSKDMLRYGDRSVIPE